MSDTIKGSIIGALITGIISILIFFLGNFSTQKSIVESLSVRFDSVDKKMSYEQALETIYQESEEDKKEIDSLNEQIDRLNLKISVLNTEVNEKKLQIDSQQSQEEINKIIQNATDYWNNSDFVQALTILKNSKLRSSDVESLYEQYSNEYIDILINNADVFISEKKYDNALKLINENLELVTDSNILNDKIEEINNIYPKTLSEIKISASRYFDKITDRSIEDTVGNNHQSGNLFEISAHDGDEMYGYATLYLGEKYASISGIIAVSNESENAELDGHIEIYSKNENNYNLLYKSPIVKRASSPINLSDLNMDLSNCEWIEIRYYNDGNHFFGVDRSLKLLVSNVLFFTR